jgi:hypothetical protein
MEQFCPLAVRQLLYIYTLSIFHLPDIIVCTVAPGQAHHRSHNREDLLEFNGAQFRATIK